MQSKCADCGIKKSRFVKEQEAKGLLSSLGLKTRLSKIPLFGDIFFWVYKMNEIVNSACGPFTKNKEGIKKFMQTGSTDFIYTNELDKTCFQHDMAYDKSNDLAKRTQSDKVLRNKAFKIASDPKNNGYQRG